MKIILLELTLLFSTSPKTKTKCLTRLNSYAILQLINGISSNRKKSLWYFNGAAIVTFFRIVLTPSETVFSNNLALNSKYLKLILFAVPASKVLTCL